MASGSVRGTGQTPHVSSNCDEPLNAYFEDVEPGEARGGEQAERGPRVGGVNNGREEVFLHLHGKRSLVNRMRIGGCDLGKLIV